MAPFALSDGHRLLFGDASPVFLAEVALRAAVTYVGVVAVMRTLGARVAGQFTLFEVSVSVVIAAAIGVPLQSGDRGILPAMVLVGVLLLLQRLLAEVGVRHRRVQTLISGDVALLVSAGSLQLDAMRANAISRETIFSHLRGAGVLNLGAVEALYLEPSGNFSMLRKHTPRPGMSLAPAFDTELRWQLEVAQGICAQCGHTWTAVACERCRGTVSILASLDAD
jgi:uncharacterized membrane protein YcaP (DUF421 family)